MKKSVLLGFVFLFLCVANLLRLQTVHASPYMNIDVGIAYNMITNGSYPNLVVLDVRTQSEYDDGHIYGAVWIPHTELETRVGELAGHENHEVVVYCLSGGRSATASGILDSYNFTKVYNMLGGISAWQSADYPVWIATVHNVNSTFNYDTIQAAIDAPKTLDGHTILVDVGKYYENVVITKSISLIGENRSTTIIYGNGTGSGTGIALSGMSNVTIRNLTIKAFDSGIWLSKKCDQNCFGSSNNTISGNDITDNQSVGIGLGGSSSNNSIFGNIIANNYYGFSLSVAFNNTFYHNNFINNNRHVAIVAFGYTNFWDTGYSSGGNYWSNYTGIDLHSGQYQNETGSDGIGDSPHAIDGNNQDNYPLMGMFSDFNATSEYHVQTICNSSISDFQFNGTAICFNVTGEDATTGFCRLCIPRALMNETYQVFVNGIEVPCNLLPCSNSTHSYLYFTYNHSTEEVIIIPEFPTCTPMLLLLMVLTVVITIYKRRLLKTPVH